MESRGGLNVFNSLKIFAMTQGQAKPRVHERIFFPLGIESCRKQNILIREGHEERAFMR